MEDLGKLCKILEYELLALLISVKRSHLEIRCEIKMWSARSSRPDVFCEKGVLRNFAKFTGKHLCHSLFFNKVAGTRPQIY